MPNSIPKARPPVHHAETFVDLAEAGGIRSEHILLEGDEVSEILEEAPRTISQRFGFRNRIRRMQSVMVIYSDGFLSVSFQRLSLRNRKKSSREYTLALSHMDPDPTRLSVFAKRSLITASILTALAAIACALTGYGIGPQFSLPTAAATVPATLVAWWAFLYRTKECVEFRTMHGKALVLTLVGNFGCLRLVRGVSERLSECIREAAEADKRTGNKRLRAEVREHYRLNETGLLSTADCTDAISLTLSHFD